MAEVHASVAYIVQFLVSLLSTKGRGKKAMCGNCTLYYYATSGRPKNPPGTSNCRIPILGAIEADDYLMVGTKQNTPQAIWSLSIN